MMSNTAKAPRTAGTISFLLNHAARAEGVVPKCNQQGMEIQENSGELVELKKAST
jgi:hypothetical protein